MPRKPTDEKIAALKKKQQEIDRQIKAHEKAIKEQERKRHTTRLIAYGLLVQYELQSGMRTEGEINKKLDKILTQNSHRAAVGLPLLGIAGKSSKSVKEEQPPVSAEAPDNSMKNDTADAQKKPAEPKKTNTSRSRSKRELPEQKEEELEQFFNA